MILQEGIFLPDGEEHLRNLAIADYQGDKRRAALAHVKLWRTAVDIGAHCGLWARHLVGLFKDVHAFEPAEENRSCFRMNVPGALLYACALGQLEGSVSMQRSPDSSASAFVDGGGPTPMHALDSFDLQDVDFLKVDCVGYELPVLWGAKATLERWRPVVSVEQKPGYPQRFGLPQLGAVEFLKSLGAEVKSENGGVFVVAWP